MVGGRLRGRWGRVLRYTFGAVLCLLTVVAMWAGAQWYWSVAGLCGAFVIILGRRRIFRAGVRRTANEIVCRFVPWFEGNSYLLLVLLPIMGVASVAAGYAPGNTAWLRFTGMLILGVTPLLAYAAVRMWRRSLLRITPSALTVRLPALRSELIELIRDRVESITPKIVPNEVSGKSLQVEIAYHTGDSSSDTTKTVLIGQQLSVQPINLLNALAAWKDAANDDPSELLDRIEQILRGRSMAGV